MERKISVSTHITAFIIASVIFALGILIGWHLAFSTISQMEREYEKLRIEDYGLEIIFLMNESGEFACRIYEEQMNKFNKETVEFGSKLDFMEKKRGKMDEEMMKLKASYSLMQIRNYFLLKKIEEICGGNYTILLYFYSNENYDERVDQGRVIGEVRPLFSFITYHFDVNVDNPVVRVFINTFNITSTPTIIINDKKYEGFMDKEKLISAIKESI